MTDSGDSDLDVEYYEEEDRSRTKWDLPDIVAAAILLAFYIVVVGGLVTGILYSSNFNQFGVPESNLTIGTAIQSGSAWAGPLLTVVLLSVIAILWWQSRQQQSGDFDDDESSSETDHDVARTTRSRVITYFAQVGFLLVIAGAVASLVGEILLVSGISGQTKAYFVTAGANCAAVIVIAGAGLFASRKVLKLMPS